MPPPLLIVEDDQDIRDNLRDILEMEGYAVLEAVHGKAALDLLERLRAEGRPLPAVILLDLNMPVMSGRELLTTVRRDHPELAAIPVIIMTALPDAMELGTAAFLRKPIDLDELLRRLRDMTARG
jgi:CheY-like chemotaxis protein